MTVISLNYKRSLKRTFTLKDFARQTILEHRKNLSTPQHTLIGKRYLLHSKQEENPFCFCYRH